MEKNQQHKHLNHENHNDSTEEHPNHSMDTHSHHHHGYDPKESTGSRLLITLALNFIIPVAQIIGGILANSVALISDAVHNFSDFTAILISYIAFRIGQRGATLFNTFGYRRAEIMAAAINALLLAVASGVIIYHAVHRFFNPEAVNAIPIMILAGIGIAGNGFSALLLHRDSAHNLNMRGAFLHMVGDLLTSVAVLLNGILLMFYDWYWLDPLLSMVIVVFILKNSWSLLKASTALLMNATPSHLSLEKVQKFLEALPGVTGVHYLHAWQISSSDTAFSCHIVVPDQMISNTSELTRRIKHELLHRFKINHPVLELETEECGTGTLLCEMSCTGKQAENTCTSSDSICSNPKTFINPDFINSKDSIKGESIIKSNWHSILFHPIPFTLLRLAMGMVFIYASYDKILHPEAFAKAVFNYQILPDMAVNIVALILPWLELLLGLFLVAGIWLPGATVISTSLMALFIGALVFNQVRGLDIHCGCFSTETTQGPAGIWTIIRDISFFAASAYLTLRVFLFSKPQNS